MELNQIIVGDCLEAMRGMPDGCVDAVVTDPPYGLSFMGKKWDYDVPSEEIWRECYRVLKDGGRLLCFSGTRTMHRMVCRIEDAGFTIEDTIAWLYASGFPKHKSKLKPAFEPITVARKGGVSELEIDSARIDGIPPSVPQPSFNSPTGLVYGMQTGEGRNGEMSQSDRGRWPANVCLDEPAADLLDQQSGVLTSGTMKANQPRVASKGQGGYHGDFPDTATLVDTPGDSGGASRFYFCAKASRSERDKGLRDFQPKIKDEDYRQPTGNELVDRIHGCGKKATNHHPTVKPINLMRWLVRLVTPKGGVVLDPFCGSGTTCVAASMEYMKYIGCEIDPEYVAIAEARVEHWREDYEQVDLFGVPS